MPTLSKGNFKIELECVRPVESHARLIMEWRNDPVTRKMSFHTALKEWETFYPEFLKSFNFPDLPPLFALFEGNRVAFLRFQPVPDPLKQRRRCCEISINVAPKYRGLGLGQEILKIAKEWIVGRQYEAIYARVRRENTISQKAFIYAGYDQLDDGTFILEDTEEVIPICRYLAVLKEEERKPVFIIAEAGSNWRMGTPSSDREMAHALIDAAVEAGADAVKFQVYRPDTIYVKNAGGSDYLREGGVQEEMHELFAYLAMPYEMVGELANYCKNQGIAFMATPFSKEDFEVVAPYVSRHKIASYELGHIRLIELAARSGKPLIMSTGAATESEIAWAVNTFQLNGGQDLTLMQCSASYPALPDSLNLNALPWMKQRFGVAVGLSDHSKNPVHAPVAAVALGATVIEKHYTMSNTLPGPDHAFAIVPEELKQMVHAVRETEKMLGEYVKVVDESELELRSFARRGVQALQDIAEGECFQEGVNIAILRPGRQTLGVHSKFLAQLEDKAAKRFIPAGSGIQRGDW